MNPLFITDLFALICEQLKTMGAILKLELLSSHHQRIIRNHNWMIKLYVSYDTEMEYISRNYRFKNLNIGLQIDINRFIGELKNCHTLNLCHTKVTDASIK